MPVSKKRKNAVNKQKREVAAAATAGTASVRWSARLNGSRLMYLRSDPDFLTIIRIGRVTNAICYALSTVLVDEGRTVSGMRQFRRGSFVLAGYLHEGLNVVKSIKGRYLTYPEYEPLRALALSEEYKREREIVRTIRNVTAFHLDEVDETTRQTLVRLKPVTLPFMSGDEKALGAFYFDFADFLDLSYLAEKFGEGRSLDETASELINALLQFTHKFLTACNDFHISLCEKTKIREHLLRSTTPAATVSDTP